MGKTWTAVRHLFPSNDTAVHAAEPWCRCQPRKRMVRHNSILYIHNTFRSKDDTYDETAPARPR